MSTLQELIKKYDTDKYNLVLPNIIEADVPDYITFGVELVKLNADLKTSHEIYVLQKSYGGREAVIGIARPGLEKIGIALGLRFPPEEQKRVDDGSDPMYCCWRAAAALAGLSGVIVRTAHYEIDLKVKAEMKRVGYQLKPPSSMQDKWGWTNYPLEQVNPKAAEERPGKKDRKAHYIELPPEKQQEWIELKVREYVLSIQDNLLVRCETGARLRVIREYSGLPQKFSPEEIKKPFAILKIVPRLPSAKTEAERIALHKHLVSTFLGAYPDHPEGSPPTRIQGGPEETVKALPPSVGESANLAEDTSVEDIDVEDITPLKGAIDDDEGNEEGAGDDADLPFDADAVEDFLGEVKSIAQKIVSNKLENQDTVRENIINLIAEYGAEKLRDVPAGCYGEFLSRLEMPLKRQELKKKKELEDEEVSGKPWGDNKIFEGRYQNFLKKKPAELKTWIQEYIERNHYDIDEDPAGVKQNLDAAQAADDKTQERDILAFAAACLIYYGFLVHKAKNPYRG
jgi:hypothetical protein